MNPKIKAQIEKAQQFAKENSTLVACTASALIASKLTYDVTVNHVTEKIASYVLESERDRGHLLLQNRIMLDFINLRDLGQELQAHIISMRN